MFQCVFVLYLVTRATEKAHWSSPSRWSFLPPDVLPVQPSLSKRRGACRVGRIGNVTIVENALSGVLHSSHVDAGYPANSNVPLIAMTGSNAYDVN